MVLNPFLRTGHLHGFVRKARHVVWHDRDAPIRVCLLPYALIGPVIVIIQRVDNAKLLLIIRYVALERVGVVIPLSQSLPQNLRDVGADFVTDPGAVEARCGDSPDQRLVTFTSARFDTS